jgi:hypothetical protein
VKQPANDISQLQRVKPVRFHRYADQSAALHRHKRDGFWCHRIGGDHQITLIFSIRVIGDHNQPATLNRVHC